MKGFTLIEMTIYFAIASMVLLSSGKLLKGVLDYQADLQRKTVYLENGSRALNNIGFAARKASGFEIQGGGAGVKIIGSDEKTYSLDGGRLKEKIGAEEPFFVTGSDVAISTLVFENVGGVLHVNLGLDGGKYNAEEYFLPRNGN